jgi:quinol monooxygenase YgiN
MIIVHGTFPVKPALRDDALELMRQMAIASRAETGCISYEFYVGLSEPNNVLLFQEWESLEALQGHFDTEHMEEFLKVLPDVLDGQVATRRYEVRSTGDRIASSEPEAESERLYVHREKIIH